MDEQEQQGGLRRALEELCAGGLVEVYEDGRLLAGLSNLRFDVREEGNRTLLDRKSTRLNSSHIQKSRMPSSA